MKLAAYRLEGYDAVLFLDLDVVVTAPLAPLLALSRGAALVGDRASVRDLVPWLLAGQDKRAKFPTSKAHISAVFHSFRLIFGRAIISRNGLEAWMLFFLDRARAEHSR